MFPGLPAHRDQKASPRPVARPRSPPPRARGAMRNASDACSMQIETAETETDRGMLAEHAQLVLLLLVLLLDQNVSNDY